MRLLIFIICITYALGEEYFDNDKWCPESYYYKRQIEDYSENAWWDPIPKLKRVCAPCPGGYTGVTITPRPGSCHYSDESNKRRHLNSYSEQCHLTQCPPYEYGDRDFLEVEEWTESRDVLGNLFSGGCKLISSNTDLYVSTYSNCRRCPEGKYAPHENWQYPQTTCLPWTVCGLQTDGTSRGPHGHDYKTAGTCDPCVDGDSGNSQGNCLIRGNKLDGTPRDTDDGMTCNPCVGGHAIGCDDCVCGNQIDGTPRGVGDDGMSCNPCVGEHAIEFGDGDCLYWAPGGGGDLLSIPGYCSDLNVVGFTTIEHDTTVYLDKGYSFGYGNSITRYHDTYGTFTEPVSQNPVTAHTTYLAHPTLEAMEARAESDRDKCTKACANGGYSIAKVIHDYIEHSSIGTCILNNEPVMARCEGGIYESDHRPNHCWRGLTLMDNQYNCETTAGLTWDTTNSYDQWYRQQQACYCSVSRFEDLSDPAHCAYTGYEWIDTVLTIHPNSTTTQTEIVITLPKEGLTCVDDPVNPDKDIEELTAYCANGRLRTTKCNNFCVCADGTPVTPEECTEDGATQCATCNSGYWLNGVVCQEHSDCPAGSGVFHYDSELKTDLVCTTCTKTLAECRDHANGLAPFSRVWDTSLPYGCHELTELTNLVGVVFNELPTVVACGPGVLSVPWTKHSEIDMHSEIATRSTGYWERDDEDGAPCFSIEENTWYDYDVYPRDRWVINKNYVWEHGYPEFTSSKPKPRKIGIRSPTATGKCQSWFRYCLYHAGITPPECTNYEECLHLAKIDCDLVNCDWTTELAKWEQCFEEPWHGNTGMYWDGDTHFNSAVGGTKEVVDVTVTCVAPLQGHNQDIDKSPCGTFTGCVSDTEFSSGDACITCEGGRVAIGNFKTACTCPDGFWDNVGSCTAHNPCNNEGQLTDNPGSDHSDAICKCNGVTHSGDGITCSDKCSDSNVFQASLGKCDEVCRRYGDTFFHDGFLCACGDPGEQCIMPGFTSYKTSTLCTLESRRCEGNRQELDDASYDNRAWNETAGKCELCEGGIDINGTYRLPINPIKITKEWWEYFVQGTFPNYINTYKGPVHDYIGERFNAIANGVFDVESSEECAAMCIDHKGFHIGPTRRIATMFGRDTNKEIEPALLADCQGYASENGFPIPNPVPYQNLPGGCIALTQGTPPEVKHVVYNTLSEQVATDATDDADGGDCALYAGSRGKIMESVYDENIPSGCIETQVIVEGTLRGDSILYNKQTNALDCDQTETRVQKVGSPNRYVQYGSRLDTECFYESNNNMYINTAYVWSQGYHTAAHNPKPWTRPNPISDPSYWTSYDKPIHWTDIWSGNNYQLCNHCCLGNNCISKDNLGPGELDQTGTCYSWDSYCLLTAQLLVNPDCSDWDNCYSEARRICHNDADCNWVEEEAKWDLCFNDPAHDSANVFTYVSAAIANDHWGDDDSSRPTFESEVKTDIVFDGVTLSNGGETEDVTIACVDSNYDAVDCDMPVDFTVTMGGVQRAVDPIHKRCNTCGTSVDITTFPMSEKYIASGTRTNTNCFYNWETTWDRYVRINRDYIWSGGYSGWNSAGMILAEYNPDYRPDVEGTCYSWFSWCLHNSEVAVNPECNSYEECIIMARLECLAIDCDWAVEEAKWEQCFTDPGRDYTGDFPYIGPTESTTENYYAMCTYVNSYNCACNPESTGIEDSVLIPSNYDDYEYYEYYRGCIPKTYPCEPGYKVSQPQDKRDNNICTLCERGTWNVDGLEECLYSPLVCPAGTQHRFVDDSSPYTEPNLCVPCPMDYITGIYYYQDEMDSHNLCKRKKVCGPGTEPERLMDATIDTICVPCSARHYSDINGYSSCKVVTESADSCNFKGSRFVDGNFTEDSYCIPCGENEYAKGEFCYEKIDIYQDFDYITFTGEVYSLCAGESVKVHFNKYGDLTEVTEAGYENYAVSEEISGVVEGMHYKYSTFDFDNLGAPIGETRYFVNSHDPTYNFRTSCARELSLTKYKYDAHKAITQCKSANRIYNTTTNECVACGRYQIAANDTCLDYTIEVNGIQTKIADISIACSLGQIAIGDKCYEENDIIIDGASVDRYFKFKSIDEAIYECNLERVVENQMKHRNKIFDLETMECGVECPNEHFSYGFDCYPSADGGRIHSRMGLCASVQRAVGRWDKLEPEWTFKAELGYDVYDDSLVVDVERNCHTYCTDFTRSAYGACIPKNVFLFDGEWINLGSNADLNYESYTADVRYIEYWQQKFLVYPYGSSSFQVMDPNVPIENVVTICNSKNKKFVPTGACEACQDDEHAFGTECKPKIIEPCTNCHLDGKCEDCLADPNCGACDNGCSYDTFKAIRLGENCYELNPRRKIEEVPEWNPFTSENCYVWEEGMDCEGECGDGVASSDCYCPGFTTTTGTLATTLTLKECELYAATVSKTVQLQSWSHSYPSGCSRDFLGVYFNDQTSSEPCSTSYECVTRTGDITAGETCTTTTPQFCGCPFREELSTLGVMDFNFITPTNIAMTAGGAKPYGFRLLMEASGAATLNKPVILTWVDEESKRLDNNLDVYKDNYPMPFKGDFSINRFTDEDISTTVDEQHGCYIINNGASELKLMEVAYNTEKRALMVRVKGDILENEQVGVICHIPSQTTNLPETKDMRLNYNYGEDKLVDWHFWVQKLIYRPVTCKKEDSFLGLYGYEIIDETSWDSTNFQVTAKCATGIGYHGATSWDGSGDTIEVYSCPGNNGESSRGSYGYDRLYNYTWWKDIYLNNAWRPQTNYGEDSFPPFTDYDKDPFGLSVVGAGCKRGFAKPPADTTGYDVTRCNNLVSGVEQCCGCPDYANNRFDLAQVLDQSRYPVALGYCDDTGVTREDQGYIDINSCDKTCTNYFTHGSGRCYCLSGKKPSDCQNWTSTGDIMYKTSTKIRNEGVILTECKYGQNFALAGCVSEQPNGFKESDICHTELSCSNFDGFMDDDSVDLTCADTDKWLDDLGISLTNGWNNDWATRSKLRNVDVQYTEANFNPDDPFVWGEYTLRGCRTEVCIHPTEAGYVYHGERWIGGMERRNFGVQVSCAEGYVEKAGVGIAIARCPSDNTPYYVSGCRPIECPPPAANVTGYILSDESASFFHQPTGSCDEAQGYQGIFVAEICDQEGVEYVPTGCATQEMCNGLRKPFLSTGCGDICAETQYASGDQCVDLIDTCSDPEHVPIGGSNTTQHTCQKTVCNICGIVRWKCAAPTNGLDGIDWLRSELISDTYTPRKNFNPQATCSAGFRGAPAIEACTSHEGAVSQSGCSEVVCVAPTTDGYIFNGGYLGIGTGQFAPVVTCADGYHGTPVMEPCTAHDNPYSVSGCELDVCASTTNPAYTVTENELTSLSLDVEVGDCTSLYKAIYYKDPKGSTDESIDENLCSDIATKRGASFETLSGAGPPPGCSMTASGSMFFNTDSDSIAKCKDSHQCVRQNAPSPDAVELFWTERCTEHGGEYVLGGCDPRLCGIPTGLNMVFDGNFGIDQFDITATCADGYYNTSAITSEKCTAENYPFVVNGECQPMQCTTPQNYEVSSGSLYVPDFAPVLSCAPGYSGNPVATACTEHETPFNAGGCNPNECVAPTISGYEYPGGNISHTDLPYAINCASGYYGTGSIVECPTDGEVYIVEGCIPPSCVHPTDTDYSFDGGDLSIENFAPVITCALGYHGPPVAVVCSQHDQEYTVTGCDPNDCVHPSVAGYETGDGDLNTLNFSPVVTCAADYHGTPVATPCADDQGEYTLTGCSENVCAETTVVGYTQTTGNLNVQTFSVSLVCTTGYHGSPEATKCTTHGGEYSVDGCEEDTCISTTNPGYTHTGGSLGMVTFSATVECTSDYHGTAEASICLQRDHECVVSGCEANDCVHPSTVGYTYDADSSDKLNILDFGPTVACADYYHGMPVATKCSVDGGEYSVSGCEENVCVCDHGTAVASDECTANGANQCTICSTGYWLNGVVCEAHADCPAGQGAVNYDSELDTNTVCEDCTGDPSYNNANDKSPCGDHVGCVEDSKFYTYASSGDLCTLCAENSEAVGNFVTSCTCKAGYWDDSGTCELFYECTDNEHEVTAPDATTNRVCEVNVCIAPTTAGYEFNGGVLDVENFAPLVECAEYYHGAALANKCTTHGDEYSVSGCNPYICTEPSNIFGYVFDGGNLNVGQWAPVISCQTGFHGTPVATPCDITGEDYTVTGCEPSNCAFPSTSGYIFKDSDIFYDGKTYQLCDGDSVDVTWTGYHNIIEVTQAGYAAEDKLTQFGEDVHIYESGIPATPLVKTLTNLGAQPRTTRYFLCETHPNKKFAVTCSARSIPYFNAFVECADGYDGSPQVQSCTQKDEPFVVSGCVTDTCVAPTTEGYAHNGGDLSLINFNPTVACAEGFEGTPSATVCSADGEAYTVDGCTPQACETLWNNPDTTKPEHNIEVQPGFYILIDGVPKTHGKLGIFDSSGDLIFSMDNAGFEATWANYGGNFGDPKRWYYKAVMYAKGQLTMKYSPDCTEIIELSPSYNALTPNDNPLITLRNSATVTIEIPKGYYGFNIPVVPDDLKLKTLFGTGADNDDRIIATSLSKEAQYYDISYTDADGPQRYTSWDGQLANLDLPTFVKITSFRSENPKTLVLTGAIPSSVDYTIPSGFSGFGIAGVDNILITDLFPGEWENGDRIICTSQAKEVQYYDIPYNDENGDPQRYTSWDGQLTFVRPIDGCTVYKQTAGSYTLTL